MASKWDSLLQDYPIRTREIQTLRSVLHHDAKARKIHFPTLFMHGPRSTGKTSILRRALADVPHVLMYTIQYASVSLLLDAVVKKVREVKGMEEGARKRRNAVQFVEEMGEILGGTEERSEPFYLVFDKAEHMRSLSSPSILPVIMKLSEITRSNICVILVSHLHWDRFDEKATGYMPAFLTFKQPTIDELKRILVQSRPSGQDEGFYKGFVDIVLPIFHTVTIDLMELRRIHELLYIQYTAPINQGKATADQKSILYYRLQFFIKEGLNRLFTPDFADLLNYDVVNNKLVRKDTMRERHVANADPTRVYSIYGGGGFATLPPLTCFLIVAAFLASHNPQKTDATYFEKDTRRRKLSKRGPTTASKRNQGAKLFPVERMWAIFRSVAKEEGYTDPEHISQVELSFQTRKLERFGLIQRSTPIERLNGIKYKCLVSPEYAHGISKRIRVEMGKYLHATAT
ncbi:Origin recognition complex subunit 5 [Phlyctochytrium bullatum]|nr:Origin recognition complex subunit 5 [Phlyctochytrium bullatum]